MSTNTITRLRTHAPSDTVCHDGGVSAKALPDFDELVRGAAFQHGNALAEAVALCREIRERRLCQTPGTLSCCLTEFDQRPRAAACAKLSIECAQAAGFTDASSGGQLKEYALRFAFYAATAGDHPAASIVATRAMALSRQARSAADSLKLIQAALGWLAMAGSTEPTRDDRNRAAMNVGQDVLKSAGFDQVGPVGSVFPDAACCSRTGVIVLEEIGSEATPAGAKIEEMLQDVIGQELPLLATPDLGAVREQLVAAYPHAVEVIDAILGSLTGRSHVAIPPTLLIGPPGCGKTSLAQDLLSALGVPHLTYPASSSTDASIAGAPRRWATAGASLPFTLIARHGTPSVGLILDEIEKAGSSSLNGRLHDAVLGMLEPKSAATYYDAYLEAPVDLSHVLWLATANSLDGVPGPLRDRLRVLRMSTPRPEHLPALSASLLKRACQVRGLSTQWALPLDRAEQNALADTWRGGSLRQLNRLVEAVIAARDHAPSLH